MERLELFRALKGNDAGLLGKLEELRGELGLTKLYFIYIADFDSDPKIVWGVRPLIDEEKVAEVKAKLSEFVKERAGLDFSLDKIEVLCDPLVEVENVLSVQVIPYIHSHGGDLNILGVDEVSGLVLVELSGACTSGCQSSAATMNNGIRSTLIHLLPWVKKVEQPGSDVEEPDFGIPEALRQAELDVQHNKGDSSGADGGAMTEERAVWIVNEFIFKELRPIMKATAGKEVDVSKVVVWATGANVGAGTLSLGLALSQGTGCSPFCGCAARGIVKFLGERLRSKFSWASRVSGEPLVPPPNIMEIWNRE